MAPSERRQYIAVEVGMPRHPKVEGLSDKAFRILILCWASCHEHLTDGVVPREAWLKRGPAKARAELITAGLVHDEGELGLVMHDYLEHQQSRAEVEAYQARQRAKGVRSGQVRRAKRTAGSTGGSTNGRVPVEPVVEPDANRSRTALEVRRTTSTTTLPAPPAVKEPAVQPPVRSRPPDLLFDAVIDAFDYDASTLTAPARANINAQLKHLREANATPDQIKPRLRRLRQQRPDKTVTLAWLVKEWPLLGHDPVTAGSNGSGRYVREDKPWS